MGISAPIKQVLSKFPLVVYPSDNKDVDMPAAKLAFRNSRESRNTFNLGVYNVVPLSFDNNVAASLDPVCFYCMLLLAYKQGYKLPHLDDEGSGNCISVLSYHSAVDGQLPILVEDEDDRKERKLRRKIRSAATIEKFNLSTVSNPKELMYIQLVDTRLYDYFMAKVLRISATSIYSQSNTPFNSALGHLVRRNGFSLRNPAISAQYTDSVHLPLKYTTQAIQNEHDRCDREGKQLLEWLEGLLEDELFFDKPGVLDFKLAAYIYALMNIEDVELEYPKLKAHCRRIIAGVI
ncbi:hypothetical protein KL905_002202 [Ogataea polymorpha]|nr:hypothetical protein KL937_001778 [Ogataea polymorpha]KAG7889924.1 hypothetical protein KL936_002598 [Ogataea polymorpha]KAG7893669.1 hypothetical protein KL908_002723 [Ogataea polymorpha]KAG7901292.1 hypothetical protein KL935_002358 [Ogataea polymorpha]KAG7909546.1 hypothetical protein KL906_002302 [Ogataea polymorpha]